MYILVFVIISWKEGAKMIEQDYKIFLDMPTLKTDRLILRKITKKDVYDIFEYASREAVSKYLLWSPHNTIDHTKAYLANLTLKYKKGKLYDFGIEYNGKIIGTVGFTTLDANNNIGEIGYVLSDKYWGLGLGFEAADKILSFGFCELRLNRIEVRYMKENIKSENLAKKLGMKSEGMLRQAVFCKGEYKDICVASILRDEYLKKR